MASAPPAPANMAQAPPPPGYVAASPTPGVAADGNAQEAHQMPMIIGALINFILFPGLGNLITYFMLPPHIFPDKYRKLHLKLALIGPFMLGCAILMMIFFYILFIGWPFAFVFFCIYMILWVVGIVVDIWMLMKGVQPCYIYPNGTIGQFAQNNVTGEMAITYFPQPVPAGQVPVGQPVAQA